MHSVTQNLIADENDVFQAGCGRREADMWPKTSVCRVLEILGAACDTKRFLAMSSNTVARVSGCPA